MPISLTGLPGDNADLWLGAKAEPYRQDRLLPPGTPDETKTVTGGAATFALLTDGSEGIVFCRQGTAFLSALLVKAPYRPLWVSSLDPSQAPVNSGDLTLRVLASKPSFSDSSELFFNNGRERRKFVSAYELTTVVKTDGTLAGSYPVYVENGGVRSSALMFTLV